jgi:hypothetical protein
MQAILSHLAGLPLLCEVEEGGEEVAGGGVAFVSPPTSVTLDRSVEEPDEPVRGPVRSAIGCAVVLEGWVDVVAGLLVKSPNESRRLPSSPKEPSSLVRSDSRLLPSVVEVLGGGLKTEPPEPGAADDEEDEEEEGWVLVKFRFRWGGCGAALVVGGEVCEGGGGEGWRGGEERGLYD